ncbi:MAG: radical SAM protein [Spirochaetales bacterium]|nr:radical SAM protein [Spirochaetales bacterium]
MGKKLAIIHGIISNQLKLSEFALNNICTAKCNFCSIWKQRPKHMVETEPAIQAIRRLADLGVRFLTLTGGEPLLHPNIEQLVEECSRHSMISAVLNADARLYTEERMDALKRSRVDLACISVDHHEEEIVSRSRSIPGLLGHIQKAVDGLKKRGITTLASTLICTYNHRTLRELFQKCKDIGFDMISVNYPEFSESPVYTIGGDAINLTKLELVSALNDVMELKKEFNIINTRPSIRNILKYLQNEPPDYMCLGGYKVVFVDWNYNVYPCMFLGRSLGNLFELNREDFKYAPCNKCNMSWYRDLSIYLHGMRSLKPVILDLPFILGSKFA